MKKIIIFTLKMSSPVVFNSHWFVFADMKPLIGGDSSTDQLDTVYVCPNGNPLGVSVWEFLQIILC